MVVLNGKAGKKRRQKYLSTGFDDIATFYFWYFLKKKVNPASNGKRGIGLVYDILWCKIVKYSP